MKKYELTDEHRAELKPWSEKWIANAMSTKGMDEDERELCRKAVKGLYESAGLPAPKHIVFVPSPFVLSFAGGFAAAIWHQFHKGKVEATEQATEQATGQATEQATEQATRQATWQATWQATRQATWQATEQATEQATRQATRQATEQATWENWYVFHADPRALANDLGVGQFGLMCADGIWRMWQGGNQWAGYDSFLTFFRHVALLPLDYSKYEHWEKLALHSGPRIMHPDFCMISDRPEVLKVDEENRPHCDDGPFCKWRDGSALYSVHGVRVPAWLIESPERLTVDRIEKEENAEVRRVMIERYGQGRYIEDSGAVKVHQDDWGTLYRKELADDEPIVTVKVTNSTAEPDGSFKDYHLRVHPELRPIMNGKIAGEPQKPTALNAVASTMGMTGAQYTQFLSSYEALGLGAAQS